MNCNEDLESTLLEKSELSKMAQPLPVCCGVYFLFDSDELVYVGQSKDVYQRVVTHRIKNKKKPRKVYNRFTIIPCGPEKLDELETLYIAKFNPKYNNTIPSGFATKWKSVNQLKDKYCFSFRRMEFYNFLKEYNVQIIKKRIDINAFNEALLKKFRTIEPKTSRQYRLEIRAAIAEKKRDRNERARLGRALLAQQESTIMPEMAS